MQGVNAYVQKIAVFVDQSDCFLLPAIYVNHFQAIETAHAMVNMGNKIARLQIINFFQCECLPACKAIAKAEFMIAVENLVIGIAKQFQVIVNESFMHCNVYRFKRNIFDVTVF